MTDIHEAAVAGLIQQVDIKSRWRHNWKLAQVVNSHLVCDPTIRQPGFNLPRQQWSLLNRFRTEQGHCCACRRKWRLTVLLATQLNNISSKLVWTCTNEFLHACSQITRKSSHLGGPDGLVKRMKDFEAEAIFLGRPFKQLARCQ